jgi:hypothetical protein
MRCESTCVCKEPICMAKGWRQCTQCRDVLKSKCTKKKCRESSVQMKFAFCGKKKEILRVADVYTDSENDEFDGNFEDIFEDIM